MPALRTSFCDQLGIDLPIIQAPIGSASGPALAAAVSNAGGFGMLSVTWRDPDEVRAVVRETRRLTSRPFGVNLVLHWDPTDRLRICLDEGVRAVSFFWGDPAPYIESVHAAGALVMQTVASAADARRVVEAGVDVVVAQGWEAGGHVRGEVATLALVPRVVDAVSPVPVVAAGGIADGRGIAAVLALGANGAWLGTRFLASAEAVAHPVYQQAVVAARETDTLRATVFDEGWLDAPARALRNSTVRAWEEAGRPSRGRRPGDGEVVAYYGDGAPVPRYSDIIPDPGMTGAIEALALYAGQSAGLIDEILPAGEIVRRLADEAVETIRRMAGLVHAGG